MTFGVCKNECHLTDKGLFPVYVRYSRSDPDPRARRSGKQVLAIPFGTSFNWHFIPTSATSQTEHETIAGFIKLRANTTKPASASQLQ